MRLSGNDESSWLEMKAGMRLLDEDRAKGETEKDLYWNIACAAIEIMNTSGGILLIGIQDKTHNVVPLSDNDMRHVIEKSGMEAYRRKEILERIWPDEKKWNTKKGTWSIEEPVPENLVEVIGCQYKGQEIAAVLLKPANPCIRVWENAKVEQIRAREPGEIGKAKEVIGSKRMADYENQREIETAHLSMLYEQFLAEVEAAQAETTDAVLEEQIEEYYINFEQELKKRKSFDLSCFTSLDASGEVGGESEQDDFMSPQAIEIIESDDWLNDNEDDDDDDDDDIDGDNEDDIDDDNEDDEDDEDDDKVSYREKRVGDLLALMHEIPRMLVLGEPGGGKTTTLEHFVLQCHGDSAEKSVLAAFIRMGLWRKGGSLALMLSRVTGLDAVQWGTLLKEGRLRLVIDAVNECPDELRPAAIVNIQSFLHEYPDVPAVIAARTGDELECLHLPAFTVQPMDENHQRQYLTRYLGDKGRADELFARLQAMSGGQEIAANPMLLRLVVDVVRKEQALPAGRADLYHKWLSQWHRRELSKARQAGDSLPYDFGQTLQLFAELAFKSRVQGYRDVPIEIAEDILRAYGEDAVEKLCQGPVVTGDEEFIRFRHETFQEYLCAEYLVSHPDALPKLSPNDYAQWGMPLAYASELKWPLPELLWLAAWQMNPWFGLAVTDQQRMRDPSPIVSFIQEPQQDIFKTIFSCDWDNPNLTLSFTIFKEKTFWYTDDDIRLKYIIATKPEINRRWLQIELWQAASCKREGLPALLAFSQRMLAIKMNATRISLKNIKQTFLELAHKVGFPSALLCKAYNTDWYITSWNITKNRNNAYNMISLIKSGLASKDDFADYIQKSIRYGGRKVMTFYYTGLATREDLIANAIPSTARKLIDEGLATKNDFAEKIHEWIQTATPRTASTLILSGLATRDDFAEKIHEWIQTASLRNAIVLIRAGLATFSDFAERMLVWCKDKNKKNQKIIRKIRKLELTTINVSNASKTQEQTDKSTNGTSPTLQPSNQTNSKSAGWGITITKILFGEDGPYAFRTTTAEGNTTLRYVTKEEFESITAPTIGGILVPKHIPAKDETAAALKCPSPAPPQNPAPTPSPVAKPSSMPTSDTVYTPTIGFKKAIEKRLGTTTFSQDATSIRIYIDETWPGLQNPEFHNVGVIGGIVWIGDKINVKNLPWILTHRRNATPIKNLQKCKRAFPFIFPIIKPHVTESNYPELLDIALTVLLGWILPQEGKTCDVKIFCEGINTSQMLPGENYASRFTESCKSKGLSANRMSRWRISEFVTMPQIEVSDPNVEGKNFEYIPYADGVCYMAVPTPSAEYLSRLFNVRGWSGYVSLDENLLRRLIELDDFSPDMYADKLMDFADAYQKTKIFYYVLAQASQKAKENSDFRNALLERLEKMFEEKERDIPLLTYLCEQLVKCFSLKDFEGYPRQKLLRLLVEMQAANHKGKPEDARKCVSQYRQLRDALLDDNRELCAYTDMNVAVHCNDSFDFSEAADICRNWEKDPSFNYLSSRIRGMILSSIGQSYAFAGDCLKAHEYFINAIKMFENNHLDDEQDQTAVYCVHNALDCKNYPGALKMAETVFKCDFKTAIANLAGTTLKPYHHHILVKNLFFNPEAAQYRSAYISLHNDWQYEMQHPWELIGLYRVLLLYRVNTRDAQQLANKLWELFAQLDDGATIKLLGAFAHCAIERCCGLTDVNYKLDAVLNAIQKKLPMTATSCDALRHYDSLEALWRIIPFYYK